MSEPARALLGRKVVVEVPATVANLGAGYDCLGLAIDLALVVSVEARSREEGRPSRADKLEVTGEGAGELEAGKTGKGNRFIEGLEAGLAATGFDDLDGVGWRIAMTNPIPLARGLGSSGAATVAGLLAAAVLGHPPGKLASLYASRLAEPSSELRQGLLALATRIEDHPDNVAPALLGGFVASLAVGGEVEAFRFDLPAELRVVLFIPDVRLATAEMRRVLPDVVPRADALANLARVAHGVAGIASGRLNVLRHLTEDRLHEPYRAAAFPELPELEAAARGAGAIGVCLAGSGSTIAAFALPDAVDSVGQALAQAAADRSLAGRVQVHAARNAGASIVADG